MKYIILFFNEEYLPSFTERQKRLFLTIPHFQKWTLELDTKIGIFKTDSSLDICFSILGFGFHYNENWDL